jgi:NAD(P) transhydrogenase subunit alpha
MVLTDHARTVGVPRETFSGERRVALVPASVPGLLKAALEVQLEAGAGLHAGYSDAQYANKGARIVATRDEAFTADILLHVRVAGANHEAGRADLQRLRAGQVVIGMCDPLDRPQAVQELAQRGVTLLALELLPRIARAQSMDVLSSMATVAGYRAVLLAATALPKMFPMLMTAAGTVAAAKMLVVGAGVAGLQAIATGRRLGAVVSAYDVRPTVKEHVRSLGARFVEMALDTKTAEDEAGYAKEMDEAFYQRQRELMSRLAAESDVVITTAVIPGRPAPLLVTASMVAAMAPGSVIVDVAAERGGNCELTRPDQTVVQHGVTILGPTNLPSDVPHDASQMYARNIAAFLLHVISDGRVQRNSPDEIVRETLVAHGGQIVHPRVAKLLSSEDLTVA